MTATAAVFDTTELFEQILSLLTMEELTRAQQVSRSWNTSITASPELKRTLLFELQPGAILPRVLRENFRYHKNISTVVLDKTNDVAQRLLPILRFAPPIKVRIEKRRHDLPSTGRREKDVHYLSLDIRDLLSRPPGAWEHMRLTQPLLKNIEAELKTVAATNQPGGDLWESLHLMKVDILNPEGIRIADITQRMRAIMKDYEDLTGEPINMTSFWDATFKLPHHVFEGSKEVQKAFREPIEIWMGDPLIEKDLEALRSLCIVDGAEMPEITPKFADT